MFPGDARVLYLVGMLVASLWQFDITSLNVRIGSRPPQSILGVDTSARRLLATMTAFLVDSPKLSVARNIASSEINSVVFVRSY